MKKQITLPAGVRKLSLNKKTISNLHSSDMRHLMGGTNYSYAAACCGGGGYHTRQCTQNGKTCPGHKTC